MRHSQTLAAIAALSLLSSQADAQSFTDRFKSLFGGGSSSSSTAQQPVNPDNPNAPKGPLIYCPDISIRAGASTFAVGVPGKPAAGADLRYQATITRTARECQENGGVITAHIGIQGRVIAGPATAPPTVQIPLRIAVVSETVAGTKTIATKAYRTEVTMTADGSVPFTLVAEDFTYPTPSAAESDGYIFYIGFDPQALAPEPKAKPAKKKK